MPNWCECELMVRGPSAEVWTFTDGIVKVVNDKGEECLELLQSYVPMPDALRHTISPSRIFETEQERDAHNVILAEHKHDDGGRAISRQQSVELIAEYGADNWYDWSVANWGCKWGDCDTEVQRTGPGRTDVSFETPWGPPIQGLNIIAERFPRLTFTLRYWEGGMAFKGKAIWKHGASVSNEKSRYTGPRGG